MEGRRYSAFTLVEMLVVMGILVILMTMGIAAGRFAIQRANKVQHQNAVDQLYQGLQSYYTDNREFPDIADFGDFDQALATDGALQQYVDQNAFDGGSDATYYYTVDSTGQSALVCVTLGGIDDENSLGGYCNGNGFGVLPGQNTIGAKDLDDSQTATSLVNNPSADLVGADWSASDKDWQ